MIDSLELARIQAEYIRQQTEQLRAMEEAQRIALQQTEAQIALVAEQQRLQGEG